MSRTQSPSASAATERFELVLTRAAFDDAVRRQLFDLDAYAIGPIRWRRTLEGPQMMIERLETTDSLPRGESRPPLDSYLVLHVEHGAPGWSAAELLAKVGPKKSHHAAALVLRPGQPARWEAAIRLAADRLQPVDCLRVQGPAPMVLERRPFDESQNDEGQSAKERQRWSRTVGALGEDVFERARRLRVHLIGAGRNATLAAQELAALGVSQLRIADGDALEAHNVVGTLGIDADDVGAPKVQALAKSLLRMRPDLAVTGFARPVQAPSVLAEFRQRPCDLTVSCVDDDVGRLATWLYVARESLTPHLDIATTVVRGENGPETLADARLFIPGPGNGCPVCVGGLRDLEATLYALGAPLGALERGTPRAWQDDRAGSLVPWNSIAVGAGLMLLLDYLAGRVRTSAWQRLRWPPGEGLVAHYAAVASAADCPYCMSR